MGASALVGLGTLGLEDAEDLDDPAHQQALLVDLDPHPGRRREDDVIAGLNRHLHTGLLPPVEPGPDGQDDPLLRRRIVSPGGHDEPGPSHPILVELLDHDLIEERPKLMPNGPHGVMPGPRIHAVEDIRALGTRAAEFFHTQVLFNDITQGTIPQCPLPRLEFVPPQGPKSNLELIWG
jgi:hypothetical protein